MKYELHSMEEVLLARVLKIDVNIEQDRHRGQVSANRVGAKQKIVALVLVNEIRTLTIKRINLLKKNISCFSCYHIYQFARHNNDFFNDLILNEFLYFHI